MSKYYSVILEILSREGSQIGPKGIYEAKRGCIYYAGTPIPDSENFDVSEHVWNLLH